MRLPHCHCYVDTYRLIATCSLPRSCWLLPDAYCHVVIARCLLPRGYCQMLIATWLLPDAYCHMVIATCLLPHAYCHMLIATCLLPHCYHFPTATLLSQHNMVYCNNTVSVKRCHFVPRFHCLLITVVLLLQCHSHRNHIYYGVFVASR